MVIIADLGFLEGKNANNTPLLLSGSSFCRSVATLVIIIAVVLIKDCYSFRPGTHPGVRNLGTPIAIWNNILLTFMEMSLWNKYSKYKYILTLFENGSLYQPLNFKGRTELCSISENTSELGRKCLGCASLFAMSIS